MKERTKRCFFRSPGELLRAAIEAMYPREKMQVPKRQTRYCYSDGPMFYLGQQIVKAMEDAGYPAKIVECYRPPDRQAELKAQGRSKAGPYQSPHQYFEAVDIIHPGLGWNVSEDYWEALASCVRIVARKFDVSLEHGHYWSFRDSAHIELTDWRKVRDKYRATLEREKNRRLNGVELWERFCEVLPEEAKRRG